jgi:hypothetical protein
MVNHFANSSLPAELHEGVGAALVCFQTAPFNLTLGERPWQSFHFSDQAAINSLESVREALETYEVNDEVWPVVVTGPSGRSYPCEGYAEFD